MKHAISILIALVLLAGTLSAQEPAASAISITMPGSPLGIAWGFLYGYMDTPAVNFMPQVRELGGSFTKVYLFWNQIEPKKGQYDWTAVDAFVNQLKSPEEGLISLFSSSTWAVKHPSSILPPAAAKDPADYYRFVYDTVKHCKGRVRYWQNDSEPNNPVYWAGTKEEFVAQLKVFYKAVKDADPTAVAVAGGYDGLFNPPGMPPMPMQQAGLDFFNYVLKEGRDAFDVFDLRLYGNIYTITARVDYIRQQMKALGYNKPIIATEYGGPGLFEFPVNRKYVGLAMSWTQSITNTGANGLPSDDKSGKNKIEELYDKMSTLAPETQMFMQGCSPELEKKFQRIQARDLVMRNVLAFSVGVQKTLYWELLDTAGARDNLMNLMYGKIGMVAYKNGAVSKRFPVADVYERMAGHLACVKQVKRIDVEGHPSVFLFQVDREKRGPLYVVWDRRDTFSGEDSPAVPIEFPAAAKKARAIDALGETVNVEAASGRLRLPVSITPVFIEPKP